MQGYLSLFVQTNFAFVSRKLCTRSGKHFPYDHIRHKVDNGLMNIGTGSCATDNYQRDTGYVALTRYPILGTPTIIVGWVLIMAWGRRKIGHTLSNNCSDLGGILLQKLSS